MLPLGRKSSASGAPKKAYTFQAPPPPPPEWVTEVVPKYVTHDLDTLTAEEQMTKYLIVIRGPNDPTCSQERRRQKNEPQAARGEMRPMRLIRARPREQWRQDIRKLLDDGVARTFNHICIELIDHDSATCFQEFPEQALWDLVLGGVVEYTPRAPVYFRKRAA